MTCRRAARLMLERELGGLPPAADAELDRHLARCAACATRQAAEVRLSAALGELRGETPFEIDVAARVRARLEAAPPPRRVETRPRELAAAAALALAAAGALGGALLRGAPPAVEVAGELWRVAGALWSGAASLGRAAGELLAVPARVVLTLGESLAGAASLWNALEPLALAASIGGAMLMAATVMLVVGRDLFGRRSAGIGGTAR